MEKINKQTPDLTSKNIAKITELFPNVITEKEDENGRIVKAVDFELLKQELAKDIVDGSEERYRLDWPGKRRSILKANTPINKTLIPDKESSVDFDNTKNIYIEGDNFEVLKILQESYLNKIKMIYIDPPYNTGKDFVYKDDFKKTKEEYEEELGVENEEGGRLFKNTDTNGRFHSDWLSMIYERLVIARDLLKDDGVIFISIDDNEVHNLRKICDEIFGENNFVNSISLKTSETSGVKMSHSENKLPKIKEYILIYCKSVEKSSLNPVKLKKDNDVNKIKKYLKYYSKIIENFDDEPNQWLIIDIKDYVKKNNITINSDDDLYNFKMKNAEKIVYRTNNKTFEDLNFDSPIEKIISSTGLEYIWWEGKQMLFLSDYLEEGLCDLWTHISTININKESHGIPTYSNGQKPVEMLKLCFDLSLKADDLVLDFFSGSGTTADALLNFNIDKQTNHKFIMVQIPEKIEIISGMDPKTKKTTQQLIDFLDSIGKPRLLTEIGKERIRRAGKDIFEENADKLKERETPLDIGFRAYKVADSIMQDVYKSPNDLKQGDLLGLADNIREDKKPEDILTSVILDFGLTLDLPIKEEKIGKNTIFNVDDGSLVACFDKNIDFNVIDEIAKMKPLKVVFRDASFKDDKDRINVETKFKQLSPDTNIKVI